MNKIERNNVSEAIAKTISQVRSDFERMGGVSKRLKKQAHKDRMKAFQNNAFKKESKNA
jgi:hypothetical protein